MLLIGALNRFQIPKGGEEYKNQVLFEYLSSKYSTTVVDTYFWKRSFVVLVKLFVNLFFKKWDRIIISASSQSVYTLVKLIGFFPSISIKTSYFVIGGYFPLAVKKGVFKLGHYRKLNSIVVEGIQMKDSLLESGYDGIIHVVSNFKYFPLDLSFAKKKNTEFKFLFLSRIHPDKGIDDIIKASKLLEEWGIRNYSITFYGPIDNGYERLFRSFLNDKLLYNGVLDILNDPESAYKILVSFDVMLFPTFWKGEGFPGVVIDAFVSGLPVIASNWNMNSEVIENGYNGILIPVHSPKDLAIAMKSIYENSELKSRLSLNAINSSTKYHIKNVGHLIDTILLN